MEDVAETIAQCLQVLSREEQLRALERMGRNLGIDLGVDLVRNLQQERARVQELELELEQARRLLHQHDSLLPLTPERVLDACTGQWQRATTIAAVLGTTAVSNAFGVALCRLVVVGTVERRGIGKGALYRRKQ